MTSRERRSDEGGAESPDPPLHALSDDKYVEVVLERLHEDVELPLFQELEEVKLKPSIFGLMCKELVVAPCIDLFASPGSGGVYDDGTRNVGNRVEVRGRGLGGVGENARVDQRTIQCCLRTDSG